MKPALVIPAAGASSRLGEPKALVDLAGRSALERLVASGALLDDVPPLVVTGADEAALRAALPPGVEAVHHRAWALGRTGGLACAAERRAGRDLCIAPVDCPLVPAAVFADLLAAWEAAGAPEGGWLAPRFAPAWQDPRAGRHGHPVVLGRALARGLRELAPGVSLRSLRARASPLLDVPVADPAVLDDLDTPADLARLRARLGLP